MHRKSENNEFDIVLEAEAVLAAYSERCKIYSKKAEHRKRSRCIRILLCVFGIIVIAAVMMFYMRGMFL